MFKRKVEKQLKEYYQNPNGNIPIIKGARQVGKSFIVRYTASAFFPNYVEIDLKSDYEGERLFEKAKTTKDFYLILSSVYGERLHNDEDTLVFLDEIQFYPHLITMLKDLKKERRYRYIASGSLLGITMKHIFIPMGSISEINMYPMDFEEFLWANGVSQDVIDYLKDCLDAISPINEAIHQRMLGLFRDYLVCGGLPEAVEEYVLNRNVAKMREVHRSTISYYRDDCGKYDSEHKLKISRIYDSLLSYMSNKVKRLQFKKIENVENANLDRYQDECDYLVSSGVALQVRAVANPVFPLSESMSKNLLKLYYNDVGLLTNLLYQRNIDAILSNDKAINLGSVYETAAAMELRAHGHDLFYFDSKKVGEVDFLINDYNLLSAIPVEIKSGNDQTNYRAIPKLVDPTGNYRLKKGYVFGNKNILETKDGLMTLPIYMVMFL